MSLRNTTVLVAWVWLMVHSPPINAAPRPLPLVAMPPAEAAALTSALGHTAVCTRRGVGSSRGRSVVGFVGADFNASIDSETGILTDFFKTEASASGVTGPPLLTRKQAQEKAVAFLDQHGIQVEGTWMLKTAQYHPVGPGLREYNFDWVKTLQGVQLPSLILMSVGADSGDVESYKLIDDPVYVSLQPSLAAEDAVGVLAEKKGWAHPVVRQAELIVWYAGGYPGPQSLIWRLEIANPDGETSRESAARADIDARSGEILTLFSPLGFARIKPGSGEAKSIALPRPDLKALRTAKPPPTVFQLAKMRKAK